MGIHAPDDYRCPFCALASGADMREPYTSQQEVVLREPDVLAFVASHQWPQNPGHAVVIPRQHFENLYELPDSLAVPIQAATRRIALALKAAYGCAGISTRQHNEPAGNQEVWHYHVHVFPRFAGDGLYGAQKRAVPAAERVQQASRVRAALQERPAI